METTIKKETAQEDKSIVVNQIILRTVDRSNKDIGDWLNATKTAEQIIHPNRTRLYDLYTTVVELDGHLTGLWGKRIASVRNKKLTFTRNGKKVDDIVELIKSQRFRFLQKKIMEKESHGLSGIEFIPGEAFFWKEINRKHIKPQTKKITFEQSGEADGVSYDGVWNLWILKGEDDLGFFLKCAPYVIYKKGAFADWAQYIEIFGQPVRIMKYDANDIKTKMELHQVVDEAGSSLAILIPKQADFEMMDGKTSNGNGELQEKFKNSCNDELSVLVLGNTETTSNTNGGSNAKATEHGKQQAEIMKDDMEMMLNTLNDPQFISILRSYGYAVDGGKFEYEKEFDAVVLKADMELDKWLVTIIPLDDDYFYGKYGRPKPKDYDARRKQMDDERNAKFQQQNKPGNEPPKPGAKNKQKKKLEAKNNSDLNLAQKLLNSLSNFFDQAPKS